MKVKVIISFKDKYTGDIYQKGTEIEISNERFEEINSTALGVFVKDILDKKTTHKQKRAPKSR